YPMPLDIKVSCIFIYTFGPSKLFFFVKFTGFFLFVLPRHTSHRSAARNRDEYVPTINPMVSAIAKPVMDCAPRNKKAKTATKVVIDVLMLLVNVCNKLLLTIAASSLKVLTRFFLRTFSRIRSNTTIVSLIE